MSKEEIENYLAALGPAIQQLIEGGKMKLLRIIKRTMNFFAVWTFLNLEKVKNLKKKLREQAGIIILTR